MSTFRSHKPKSSFLRILSTTHCRHLQLMMLRSSKYNRYSCQDTMVSYIHMAKQASSPQRQCESKETSQRESKSPRTRAFIVAPEMKKLRLRIMRLLLSQPLCPGSYPIQHFLILAPLPSSLSLFQLSHLQPKQSSTAPPSTPFFTTHPSTLRCAAQF